MAIAFVQSDVANDVSVLSSSVTLLGVATGNLIVVCIVTSGAGTSVTSVTDGTNTYTQRSTRIFLAGVGGQEQWEAHNVTGGDLTITANYSGAANANLACAEYSGIDTSSPFDQTSKASGTSTTPSSGNVATSQADELLIGFVTDGVFTYDGGWNLRENGDFQSFLADRIVAVAGNYAASGTIGASQNWTASITTYKAPAAPPGTNNTRQSQFMLFFPPTTR